MNRFLLYTKPGCPYCDVVLEFATERGIKLDLKYRNDPGIIDELVERGGKCQFPYLVDREDGIEMYESADIVDYLDEHAAASIEV